MPTAKELEAVLARTPLFGQTSKKQRAKIVQAGRTLSWKSGKVVVEQGSRAAAFYVILDGTAEVSRGGAPINRLREGDFFGEVALLSGGDRTATVTATSDIEVFALGRPAFRSLVQSDSDLALEILKALADRVDNNF